MKFDDLISTLKYHERLENCRFFEIDLVHEDFDQILNELNFPEVFIFDVIHPIHAGIEYQQRYIKINGVNILSSNLNKNLKKGYACFSKTGEKYGVLFKHAEILNEKELIIKELLE